jgi:outer membrane protein OmpA-like peptidoglycan-associated protein
MWRHLAIVAVGLLGASGAMAQEQLVGRAIELVPRVESLVFGIENLVFKIENIGGQVQALQVKETATETRIELPADILFDFDKDQVRQTAEPALKQAADLIRANAKGTVRIEGHTDAKGADVYNLKLSQRRAQSVQIWLTERGGLRGVRFVTQGLGKNRPAAPNAKPDGSDDPEGRQKNRRVEIVFGRR